VAPLETMLRRPRLPLLSLLGTIACAHPGLQGEEVLERGGELAQAHPEQATVAVTADTITVWGITEVPDGSRLQMALAGVDAITRSELLKAVEVRVTSTETDVESNDPSRRSLKLQTIEAVDGVLPRATPMPHGWARVRRGDDVVLRLWARLEVSRESVEAALRSVRASHLNAAAIVDGLPSVPTSSLSAQ
jgi:hypothetical protein